MRKETKIVIVAVVVFILALGLAYASYTGILNISGRATAAGNFEVIFTNGAVSTAEHGTATVDVSDNTRMSVAVNLAYPGDGCYVTATVKNNGNVPAKLTGFDLYNQGTTTAFSNADIEVLIPDLDLTGAEVLGAGETSTITFTVKWKTSSTAISAQADFDIVLNYEQSTTEFSGN